MIERVRGLKEVAGARDLTAVVVGVALFDGGQRRVLGVVDDEVEGQGLGVFACREGVGEGDERAFAGEEGVGEGDAPDVLEGAAGPLDVDRDGEAGGGGGPAFVDDAGVDLKGVGAARAVEGEVLEGDVRAG